MRRATVPWPYCTFRQQTTSPYRGTVRSHRRNQPCAPIDNKLVVLGWPLLLDSAILQVQGSYCHLTVGHRLSIDDCAVPCSDQPCCTDCLDAAASQCIVPAQGLTVLDPLQSSGGSSRSDRATAGAEAHHFLRQMLSGQRMPRFPSTSGSCHEEALRLNQALARWAASTWYNIHREAIRLPEEALLINLVSMSKAP